MMIVSVQHFPRSYLVINRLFAHRVAKFGTETALKSASPAENEKVAVEKQSGDSSMKATRHLVLHKAEKRPCPPNASDKPLVLLFQWLYAKPSALAKYCDIYHDIGLDVLAVRGKLSHFLWPPKGTELSDELFEYLKSNRPASEKFVVHALSVGAYNHTIAMHAALQKQQESGQFRDRVIGQIFDSIVIGTYENMSHGISQVLPENQMFRNVVLRTLDLYYKVTHKKTAAMYDRLVSHFKEEPIPVPTLVIYSDNDPMCDTAAMEKMLADWRSQQPEWDVTKLSWAKSTHAAHLKEHREDYMREWRRLMEKLKLV